MCGIAGIISASPLKPLQEIAQSMSCGSLRGSPLAMLAYSALTLQFWCAAYPGHLPASELACSTRHRESVQRC